ncbi:hypothetical protein WA026_021343 [Henosepilachna vigintioctopunctata]|uniref:FP protein C-terminal domain-containing protein n=1 Tax=Henosepilachna vigintioctopunctata TaxID=420089 RepID=A0AAW1UCK2_9CUCU
MFNNAEVKKKIVKANATRKLTTRDLGYKTDTQVYINNDLTKQNIKLLKAAKKFKEENNYKYLWVQEGLQLFKKLNIQPSVNIAYMNIQSARNKQDELQCYVSECEMDIRILVETWLSDFETQTFLIKGYEGVHSCRTKRGGGASIFIRNGIKFSLVGKSDTCSEETHRTDELLVIGAFDSRSIAKLCVHKIVPYGAYPFSQKAWLNLPLQSLCIQYE